MFFLLNARGRGGGGQGMSHVIEIEDSFEMC